MTKKYPSAKEMVCTVAHAIQRAPPALLWLLLVQHASSQRPQTSSCTLLDFPGFMLGSCLCDTASGGLPVTGSLFSSGWSRMQAGGTGRPQLDCKRVACGLATGIPVGGLTPYQVNYHLISFWGSLPDSDTRVCMRSDGLIVEGSLHGWVGEQNCVYSSTIIQLRVFNTFQEWFCDEMFRQRTFGSIFSSRSACVCIPENHRSCTR